MSDNAAGQAADMFLPPTLTGTNPSGVDTKVTRASTSSTAARSALATTRGKYHLTVAAITTDVFVAFKLGTAAASVTTSTGWQIAAGQERSWWINATQVNDIEYVTATAAGAVAWFISSPILEAQ